jgi:hypothetical protein
MATPEKVSGFPAVTSAAANSVLLIVTWPYGIAVDNTISLTNLFGTISANVYTTGTLKVDSNTTLQSVTANTVTITSSLKLTTQYTPSSSSDAGIANGSLFYDSNYLYISTATGVIKRVALGSF